jgi:hypothetical protein
MAVKQLGIPEAATKSATGGILSMVQKHVGAGDFTKLLGGVPGINDMMKQGAAAKPDAGVGGAIGGMLGKLGGNLPGGLGQAAGLMGIFQGAGLGGDKMGPFVGLLFNYLKGKAGAGNVDSLLTKLPEIKKLLG